MSKLIVNRTFLKWWFSYIAILFLPIIAGAIFYTQSVNRLSNEIDRSYSFLLEQMKLSVDDRLSRMIYISQELTTNKYIEQLEQTPSDKYQPSEVSLVVSLQEDLRDICSLNGDINNIFIFFPASNMILSKSSTYRNADLERAMSDIGNSDAGLEKYFECRSPFFEINDQNPVFCSNISPFITPDTPSVIITIKNNTLANDLKTDSVSKAFGGVFLIEQVKASD